jgi:threonine dehydratase
MRWRWRQQQGLTFVHPYDDEAIVAGQGTVGLEMLEAEPDLDTLVIAVGGGGLISGIATAAKRAASRASRSWACRPAASRPCSTPSRARSTHRAPARLPKVLPWARPGASRRSHHPRNAWTTWCWWTRATSSRPS